MKTKFRGSWNFWYNSVSNMVYGGPYLNLDKEDNLIGVKMAKEISTGCHISIPTADFSVPDPIKLEAGIRVAMYYMKAGRSLYVGCMGGIGRTGLFMACLAKVMLAHPNAGDDVDPVEFIREFYYSGAVETQEQQQYVKDFDIAALKAIADNIY